jgi:hypothetical protein
MNRDEVPATLTPDEVAAIAEAEAEIERGERVPPQIIDEFWRAHL